MADLGPRTKARITGLLFLLTIVFGAIGESLHGRLVVPDNPAATASAVLAHTGLLRFGFASYMVEMACQIAVTGLFYDLLKPVSRSVSLLAAFFGLVGITIKALSRLFFLAPLLALGSAEVLGAFTAAQREGLALLLFKVNAQGAGIALIFFGFYTLLKGYLIIRSTFLPRLLGALGVVAGLGWLTFLVPPLAARLFPYVVGVGLLVAAAQIIWLLVVGVNEERWREQASQAAKSIWA